MAHPPSWFWYDMMTLTASCSRSSGSGGPPRSGPSSASISAAFRPDEQRLKEALRVEQNPPEEMFPPAAVARRALGPAPPASGPLSGLFIYLEDLKNQVAAVKNVGEGRPDKLLRCTPAP